MKYQIIMHIPSTRDEDAYFLIDVDGKEFKPDKRLFYYKQGRYYVLSDKKTGMCITRKLKFAHIVEAWRDTLKQAYEKMVVKDSYEIKARRFKTLQEVSK